MNAERQRDMSGDKLFAPVRPDKKSGEGVLLFLKNALLGAVALLFARAHVLFGAYPLAFSLLSVVRGNPLFVWLGAVVGAFTMSHDGWIYAAFYTLLLGLRFVFSAPRREKGKESMTEGYFREMPQLQVTAVLLTGAGLGLWQLLKAGLTTYALLFAAATTVVPAVCTALFVGVFAAELDVSDLLGTRRYGGGEVPFGGLSPLYVEVGMLTFCSALAYALSFYSVFGLSLGLGAATLFTLFIARRWGALRGCVGGMLTATSVVPGLAPAFGILGLLAGAVFPYGTGYALVLGVGGGTLYASYFGGAEGLLGVLPEMCITALLTWPLYIKMRQGVQMTAETAGEDRAVSYAAESMLSRKNGRMSDQLRLLSDALLTVSDSFRREGMAEESPELADYFAICDKVCNRYCPHCEHRADCWEGEERRVVASIGRIAEALRHAGTVHPGRESYLPAYCPEEEGILRGIRAEAAALCGGKRKSAHSTLVATEYMMFSRLLSEESRRHAEEDTENAGLAEKLEERTRERFPALTDVVFRVKGKRRLQISVGSRNGEALAKAADEIAVIIEEETGLCMSAPAYEEVNRVGTLRTYACRRYEIRAAMAVSPCREGEVSGDVVSSFDDEGGGYAHALISDGMGCGRRAARASQLVCGVLEQFLGAGCGALHTVEMMHHLLRGRSDEASATVDLFSLDTVSGRAEFLKCGAAASYIKRGEHLYRVRAKTPPIGILRECDGEVAAFDMQPGDVVLLLSDGVCPDGEECPWLVQLLNNDFGGDLHKTAQKILALAAQKNESEDDRSVILLEVLENPAQKEERADDRLAG